MALMDPVRAAVVARAGRRRLSERSAVLATDAGGHSLASTNGLQPAPVVGPHPFRLRMHAHPSGRRCRQGRLAADGLAAT